MATEKQETNWDVLVDKTKTTVSENKVLFSIGTVSILILAVILYGMIGGDDNKRVVGMQGPVLLPVSHLLPNDDEKNCDEATMMIVVMTPYQHKLSMAVFTVD